MTAPSSFREQAHPAEGRLGVAAMDGWLSLLDAFAAEDGATLTVAIPFPIGAGPRAEVLRRRYVSSIILVPDATAEASERIGYFDRPNYTWLLPNVLAGKIVILGDPDLSGRMALRALRKGCRTIYRYTALGWHATSVAGFLALHGFRRWRWGARLSREGETLARSVADFRARPLYPGEAHRNRVVILNNSLAWGGAERQIQQTMIGLKNRGYDVVLVCEDLDRTPDHAFFLEEFRQRGLTVCRLTDFAHPLTYRVRISPRMQSLTRCPSWPRIVQYVCALDRLRPQVLHCWQDQTCVLGGVAGTMTGVPRIVLSTRNMAASRFGYCQPYMRRAYRALVQAQDVVLLNNSEAGARDYCEWLGLRPERVALVRNGYDLGALSPAGESEVQRFRAAAGIPPGVPVVGSIFRFYPEKRPKLWVEAAARLLRRVPDVHFVIAGVGPLLGEARALAGRLGIADRLHLPGTCSDVPSCLGSMAVFLLTSELEGTPNALIEAQHLGVPAVVTPAGGAAETIADGLTGYVVEPEPEAIAGRLADVLARPDWRAAARTTAPSFIAGRFGLERMIAETLACYGLGSST